MPTTLKYDGPFLEVSVPLANGRELRCEKGKTVEVPSVVAEGLLEQTDAWTEVDPPKQTKTKTKGADSK